MKKIIISVLLISIAYIFFKKDTLPLSLQKTLLPSPSPQITKNAISVEYNDLTYNIYIQKIHTPTSLKLIPNFSDSQTSQRILQKNNCAYGVNRGFYTPAKKPLGVYFTEDMYLENTIHTASLFNGFFYKTTSQVLVLSKSAPLESIEFAFQSGPLFTPGQTLRLTTDERARRMMVGQTNEGDFYFLAITDAENTHSGPYLVDLPKIMQQFLSKGQSAFGGNNITMQQFILFLNLDGGSASAFYDEKNTILSELTSIGSFLCGTP